MILSKKPSNKSTRNGIRRFSRWRKLKKRCPGRRRTLLKSCLETTNFSISRQAIRNQLIEEADCTTIDLLFEYLITLPLISPSPIPASRISLGSRPNTSCFQCRTQWRQFSLLAPLLYQGWGKGQQQQLCLSIVRFFPPNYLRQCHWTTNGKNSS